MLLQTFSLGVSSVFTLFPPGVNTQRSPRHLPGLWSWLSDVRPRSHGCGSPVTLDPLLSLPKWQLMIRTRAVQKPTFCRALWSAQPWSGAEPVTGAFDGAWPMRGMKADPTQPCSLWCPICPTRVLIQKQASGVRNQQCYSASVGSSHLGTWPGDTWVSEMQKPILRNKCSSNHQVMHSASIHGAHTESAGPSRVRKVALNLAA